MPAVQIADPTAISVEIDVINRGHHFPRCNPSRRSLAPLGLRLPHCRSGRKRILPIDRAERFRPSPPAAPEIPPIGVHLVAYPSNKNPLGVKGIGESGTVPAAAAIISGIEDALRDYDVSIEETPITPAQLVQLIQASRGSRTDG